ncbi:MAG: hypothetical protein QM754_00715 [Tepidisphaeraceae bacterium]
MAFGERDVDAFVESLTHEQFERWKSYFSVEPNGWLAFQHLIRRSTFVVAQVGSRKKLRERDFELRLEPADPAAAAAAERARFEAAAVRDGVRAEMGLIDG